MIADRNKGLTNITYNHLNLPEVVSFYDPANAEITWTYDAEGAKLRKTTNDGQGNIIVTDYINGYVYNNQTPDYYNTAEGRCLYSGGVYNTREYHLKDHLGNTRVTFDGEPKHNHCRH